MSRVVQTFLLFCLFSLTGCGGGSGGDFLSSRSLEARCSEYAYYDSELELGDLPDCSTSTLPFIGQETSSPSVNQIMDRLVYDESWVADRFEIVLERMSQEELNLFRSVRVIVITNEVNPSFYMPYTATIYISPFHLWQTEEELDTINTPTDARAGNSDPLNFVPTFRYLTADSEMAYRTHSEVQQVYGGGDRTADEAFYATVEVLYHELAHAIDFFPAARVAELAQSEDSFFQNVPALVTSVPSAETHAHEGGLQSQTLKDAAAVLFLGAVDSFGIADLSASEVADELVGDVANDFYNYTDQFEDFAMLFEELAMRRYQDLYREVLVVDTDAAGGYTCEATVALSQIGRIEDDDVSERALLAANAILPEAADEYQDLVDDFTGVTTQVVTGNICEHLYGVPNFSNPRFELSANRRHVPFIK